jgi:imidazolonepropionase-like amidohydrolase
MGTDSGAFPERFPGYFEHLEMEMMAEAGLTPVEVLRASTGTGKLDQGNWADFVVLERDPFQDIRNTRSLTGVYIAGNAVQR